MRTLNLQRLFHALIVSEECSMVAASKKLHLTQSALTRSIQNLESELGVKIFERKPSGVDLTAEGQMVVTRAKDILEKADLLYTDAKALSSGVRSIVSLGIDPILTQVILSDLLKDILSESNLMQIQVKVESRSTLMTLLQDAAIDFFVADINDFKTVDVKEIKIEELSSARGSIFVRPGHPLEHSRDISSSELFQFPIVTPSNVHETRWELPKWNSMEQYNNERRQEVICPDINTLKQLAYETDVVFATADATVKEAVDEGRLKRLDYRISNGNDIRSFGLVTLKKNTLSIHSQKIAGLIKEKVKTHLSADRLARAG